MSTPLQERMEAALVDLRTQRDKVREFDDNIASQRTTSSSKNRMVVATVDSRGKLVELSLKGNRYRSMAPAELGSLIVETVANAQEKALKETLAAAARLIPGAMKFTGLDAGNIDVDSIFDSAMRIAEEPFLARPGGNAERSVTHDV